MHTESVTKRTREKTIEELLEEHENTAAKKRRWVESQIAAGSNLTRDQLAAQWDFAAVLFGLPLVTN